MIGGFSHHLSNKRSLFKQNFCSDICFHSMGLLNYLMFFNTRKAIPTDWNWEKKDKNVQKRILIWLIFQTKLPTMTCISYSLANWTFFLELIGKVPFKLHIIRYVFRFHLDITHVHVSPGYHKKALIPSCFHHCLLSKRNHPKVNQIENDPLKYENSSLKFTILSIKN